MEVKEYLQQKMYNCSKYILTDEDQKFLDKHSIEDYIFRKLMSKKFRKWSLSENIRDKIKKQINYCVLNNEPILLNLSYGGFKLWRLPTTPEVDWSEFFYIAYHIQYMAPIAQAYRPGIYLEFSSGDIAVTTMNNVPKKDVDQYDKSLRELIKVFRSHLPKNIKINVSRLRDLFENEQQFINEGEKLQEKAREDFSKDEELFNEFKRGAVQNLQFKKGDKDLSKLSEDELDKIRQRSAEIIETMYEIPQIVDNKNRKDQIDLLATNLSLDIPMIVTGATKYSTAKFWAGMGVLVKNGDNFAEYVITPKQWEKIKNEKHVIVNINIISLNNFKQILIYPEKFNF